MPLLMTMVGVGVVTALALDEPWIISLMTGIMMNGISPAAIYPLLLKLMAQGYGANKSIP